MYNETVNSINAKLFEYEQVDIETERLLLKQAQNGDVEARDKLILVNMRGIEAICDHYANTHVTKQELYGVAICAFIETIDGFDPIKYDVRFITFARKKIHGAIRESSESNRGVIELPVHIRQFVYHIEKTLSEINTSEYTLEEIITYVATKLDATPKSVEKVFYEYLDLTNYVFLDSAFMSGADTTRMEMIPDERRNPINAALAKIDLEKLMECLNEKDREVVLRRWNILPYQTVGEIGRKWGVSSQAVSVRYVRAMSKLKKALKELTDEEKLHS